MHWILWIGLNWTADVPMGAFISEEACDKAADQYMAKMFDPEKGMLAACIHEDDQLTKTVLSRPKPEPKP